MEEKIQKKFKELSDSITNIRIASDKIITRMSALERDRTRVENQFKDITSLNFEGIWPKMTALARRIKPLEEADKERIETFKQIRADIKDFEKRMLTAEKNLRQYT